MHNCGFGCTYNSMLILVTCIHMLRPTCMNLHLSSLEGLGRFLLLLFLFKCGLSNDSLGFVFKLVWGCFPSFCDFFSRVFVCFVSWQCVATIVQTTRVTLEGIKKEQQYQEQQDPTSYSKSKRIVLGQSVANTSMTLQHQNAANTIWIRDPTRDMPQTFCKSTGRNLFRPNTPPWNLCFISIPKHAPATQSF